MILLKKYRLHYLERSGDCLPDSSWSEAGFNNPEAFFLKIASCFERWSPTWTQHCQPNLEQFWLFYKIFLYLCLANLCLSGWVGLEVGKKVVRLFAYVARWLSIKSTPTNSWWSILAEFLNVQLFIDMTCRIPNHNFDFFAWLVVNI